MVNVIDSAFVEILPDLSRFTQETERQLDQAFSDIQQSAERSLGDLESSFDDTADTVGSSFADIDPDFSGVEDSASAAADEVDASFADIDPDFSATEASAAAAAGDVADSFADIDPDFSGVEANASAAADDVADSFDSVDPDFSGVVDGAESAADDASSAFSGTGDEIADEFDTASEESGGFLQSLAEQASSVADAVSDVFSGTGDEVSDEFEEASSGVEVLNGSLAKLIAAIGGAAFLTQATIAAEEFESALTILESQMDSTGRVAGLTRQELSDLAAATSIRLGIDDTALVQAQQSISLFTDLTGQEFERTIELAADLGTFMGRELPDAARLLARGLDDPTRGLQLLERQVGQFDEGLVQTVDELTRFGRTAEAQTLILDEIERRFGGVAEASADSSARIGAVGDQLVRTLGTPIIGAIDENVESLLSLGQSLEPVAESVGEVFGTTVQVVSELSPALEGVASIIGEIPGEMLAAAGATVALNRALTLVSRHPVIAVISGLTLAIGALKSASEEAALTMEEVELSVDRLNRGRIDEGAQSLVDTFTDLSNVDVNPVDRVGAALAAIPGAGEFDRLGLAFTRDIPDAFNTSAIEADKLEAAIGAAAEESAGFDRQLSSMVSESGPQVVEVLAFMEEASGLTAEQFQEFSEGVLPRTTARLQQVTEEAENTGIATTDVADALDVVTTSADPTVSSLGDLVVALDSSEAAAADAAVVERELGIASEDLLEITPEVAEAFESLSQSVTTSMPSVGTAVDEAFSTAQEAEEEFTFQNFVDELEGAVEDARTFNEDVQALIDAGFIKIAQIAIQRGPEFSGPAADALSDPEILRGAEGLMGDLEEELDTGLDNAAKIGFEGAGAAGNRVVDGLENGIRGSKRVGREAVDGVVGGMDQRSNRVERRARGLMSGAISEARDRASESSGVGFDFARGLISGIEGQVSNVETAARNSANAAVHAARGELRAVSPSKRTAEEIGLPFSQGIAVGMLEGQSDVDRAFGSIISGLSGPDVTAGVSASGEAATTVGATTGAAASTTAIPMIEIHSDGTEMSELLVTALQRAIRIRGGNVQEVLGSERSVI